MVGTLCTLYYHTLRFCSNLFRDFPPPLFPHTCGPAIAPSLNLENRLLATLKGKQCDITSRVNTQHTYHFRILPFFPRDIMIPLGLDSFAAKYPTMKTQLACSSAPMHVDIRVHPIFATPTHELNLLFQSD